MKHHFSPFSRFSFLTLACLVLASCSEDDLNPGNVTPTEGQIEFTLNLPSGTIVIENEDLALPSVGTRNDSECIDFLGPDGTFDVLSVWTMSNMGICDMSFRITQDWAVGTFSLGESTSWDCNDSQFAKMVLWSDLLGAVEGDAGSPVSFTETEGGTLSITELNSTHMSLEWNGTCVATTLMGDELLTFTASLSVQDLPIQD